MTDLASTAPTRFDLILFVMGVALFGGGALGALTVVPFSLAGGAGTAVAGAAMFEGLARNPPTES
ncbi:MULTISPECIES: hypothetical protein [Haloprofundus]|uniref:hypothetical protein n=1 Tax=Haloprofundus TaxID=1911573 RepID=UPI000E4362D3|nr:MULTISPECIES: hypothetical protein [Haloprofundus]QCJ46071.1 hypothetical protein FCF25_02575 [Haloprofundus sp. MHR1]